MVKKLLGMDFVRFCIVGAGGFAINFALLTLCYKVLHWPLFLAQLLSGEMALFHNFILHHNWTYKDRRTLKTLKILLIQFHATSWFAIVLASVIVTLGVSVLRLHYVVALMIASSLGLLWNFLWSKYIIWSNSVDSQGAGIEDRLR